MLGQLLDGKHASLPTNQHTAKAAFKPAEMVLHAELCCQKHVPVRHRKRPLQHGQRRQASAWVSGDPAELPIQSGCQTWHLQSTYPFWNAVVVKVSCRSQGCAVCFVQAVPDRVKSLWSSWNDLGLHTGSFSD